MEKRKTREGKEMIKGKRDYAEGKAERFSFKKD